MGVAKVERQNRDWDDGDHVPEEIREVMIGLGVVAGGANVIMQLAHLPVGRGVAESRVETGRVDRHPFKRGRTTTAYLAIALLGSREERRALRRQIDEVHREVRSRPGDEVPYDAFDRDLQMWVAACLYRGVEDLYRLSVDEPDEDFIADVLYPYSARLGTTLQVRPDEWPADRAAFEEYWNDQLERIEMDDVTRSYLRRIAELSFVVAPLGPLAPYLEPLLRPIGRAMTLGFLPEEFREELGLPWSDDAQRWFDLVMRTAFGLSMKLPVPLRQFPLNLVLADTRRRLASGRPVI